MATFCTTLQGLKTTFSLKMSVSSLRQAKEQTPDPQLTSLYLHFSSTLSFLFFSFIYVPPLQLPVSLHSYHVGWDYFSVEWHFWCVEPHFFSDHSLMNILSGDKLAFDADLTIGLTAGLTAPESLQWKARFHPTIIPPEHQDGTKEGTAQEQESATEVRRKHSWFFWCNTSLCQHQAPAALQFMSCSSVKILHFSKHSTAF